jgi:hypothetical protein
VGSISRGCNEHHCRRPQNGVGVEERNVVHETRAVRECRLAAAVSASNNGKARRDHRTFV